jgi:hypothetical protein
VNVEWKGKPITLNQGDVGSVIIVDQKWENDKLTLIFEVTGEQIQEQIEDIWLLNRLGGPLPRVSPPIRIQGSDNKYEISFFNVDSNDSIQIKTPVFNPTKYLQDLKVIVNLPSKGDKVAALK